MVTTIIKGPLVYLEKEINRVVLVIKNRKIIAIEKNSKKSFAKTSTVFEFPKSYYLLPGFIDMHVHGIKGSDVMDNNQKALDNIRKALAKTGVTSFLATTLSAPISLLKEVICTIKYYMQNKENCLGASILGIHLEGPFLSAEKKGAQSKSDLLLPSIKLFAELQQHKMIKLVTLAPELANAIKLIKYLVKKKIIVGMGHTNQTYAQALKAISAGCTHATHLFNAMRTIHQREPGGALAALLAENVSVELIADGVHLHPAMIELVKRVKKPEHIILITDAMRAACLCDGAYPWGEEIVTVKDKIATLSNGALAGSTITMPEAIHFLLTKTSCRLEDIVKYVSYNPAVKLNIIKKTGSIALGKEADLVILNTKYQPVRTFVKGIPFK